MLTLHSRRYAGKSALQVQARGRHMEKRAGDTRRSNLLLMDRGCLVVEPSDYLAMYRNVLRDIENGFAWHVVERIPDGNGRICLFFDLDCKTRARPVTFEDLRDGGVLAAIEETLRARFPGLDDRLALLLTYGGAKAVGGPRGGAQVYKTGWHIFVHRLDSRDGHNDLLRARMTPFVVTPFRAREIRDSVVLALRGKSFSGTLVGCGGGAPSPEEPLDAVDPVDGAEAADPVDPVDPVEECIDDAVYRPHAGGLRLCYNPKFTKCSETKRCSEKDAADRDRDCPVCKGVGGTVGKTAHEPTHICSGDVSVEIPRAERRSMSTRALVNVQWNFDARLVDGYARDPRVSPVDSGLARAGGKRKRVGKQAGGRAKGRTWPLQPAASPEEGATGRGARAVRGSPYEWGRLLRHEGGGAFRTMEEGIRSQLYGRVAGAEPVDVNYFSVRQVGERHQIWAAVSGQFHCHNKGAPHSSSNIWFMITESAMTQRCHCPKTYNGKKCSSFSFPARNGPPPPPDAWRAIVRTVLMRTTEGKGFLNKQACTASSADSAWLGDVLRACGGGS